MKTTSIFSGLVSVASAVQYGYNHVPVRPDTSVIASAFEDVDIDLLSPAFLAEQDRLPGFPEGTQGPSSQKTLEDFMQEVADRNDYMTYSIADFTSEEHRSFPYVRLFTSTDARNKRAQNKVRVWIQGAVHGNEPAGDEAVQALLGKFDANPDWAAEILDKVEILLLPRYNPDGVFYFQRTLATNYDPNRDHIKLARQQTREIKQLLGEFNPHVVVDMHEYTASSTFAGQFVHASDGLFSAAKNLNINEGIRTMAEELFAKNIGDDMDAASLRWEPYVTGSSSSNPEYVADFAEAGTDGKIGRNGMGLTQAIVFLIEMRGIGLADQEFQRRTAAGLTMMNAIVQTAADNAADVLATVDGGRTEFAESSEDIIITDHSERSIRPFAMVSLNNGSVVYPPVRFASTTPAIADLTRSRPEAYLIPVAWADLAERLRVSGLDVETLEEEWTGSVEALTIASTKIDTAYYEGVIRVTTTTKTVEKEITLPKGSFKVSTRQQNAALAFIALEPENIDSYVTFNIIPLEQGDEYPIFRVTA